MERIAKEYEQIGDEFMEKRSRMSDENAAQYRFHASRLYEPHSPIDT